MHSYNLIIILIIILVIIFLFFNIEGFQNSMYYIENLKIYHVKELATGKTLLIKNGLIHFNYPDENTKNQPFCDEKGFPLAMTKNPTSSLELRSANDPNSYILAPFVGDMPLRLVPNPPSPILKIEIINYNQKNILGYNTSGQIPLYLKIDENGFVKSVKNPDTASIVGIIMK